MTHPFPVKTTCPYCGVGCGVEVYRDGARIKVKGDTQHPANFGRLCSKGTALAETIDLDNRLLSPMVNGEAVDWNKALDAVAKSFSDIVAQHGPDAVAFYVSGQLLTEDYYVANKLIKGFIGTANIDTNSRLCMSSAVAAHKRAFGEDTVPGSYTDLEQAELLILVGSNTAWCHPVIFQRIVAAKKQNAAMKVVVIDPRQTATCEIADLHLPLKSGSDGYLFNGLLNFLRKEDYLDWAYIEQHTEGFGAALAAEPVKTCTIPYVAEQCRLTGEQVGEFYRLFARTKKVVTVFSQGINQSSSGVDKGNAIINCHLVTGKIGMPGMGPFSITGQPNAMGGREAGGLANTLAAHMEFDKPEQVHRVERFWQAPRIARKPGLKAVDLFKAIEEKRVKAVWIMATNPVVSMPDADQVARALRGCEFVVVSDCMRHTDTTAFAHVLLPALAWGEKNGTVTNSERRISRQRSFLDAPGEAKPDWWIVSQVAQRMGFKSEFDYQTPADVFREHAKLSGFENQRERVFDISHFAHINEIDYERFIPVQWPVTADQPNGVERLYQDGRFITANGKARLVSINARAPQHAPSIEFPFVLNTGRVRDQWHTMTRTAKAPALNAHINEPIVQIHASDAAQTGVQDKTIARVITRWGSMLARVSFSSEQQRGMLFVPMHWNAQFANQSRVNALVNPVVDPISGQPELKHTPAHIEPYAAKWYGFVMSKTALETQQDKRIYAVNIKGENFWQYEYAGDEEHADMQAWARQFGSMEGEWVEFADKSARRYRGALIVDGVLQCVVFISPTHELPARNWLQGLFKAEQIDAATRTSLLTGKPPKGQVDCGPTVCACYRVGYNTIVDAIKQGKAVNVDAIGKTLGAGTNCGSCLPELKKIINQLLP